jgi:predicted kinase
MGKVRYCHGDLHLRNICLLAGRPQLFDCIEFNDAIATVDILYDLAFLLMDLWHRGLPHFANRVANRYLDAMDDDEGFSLLPFFMALRAAIRAHVIATQIERSNARSDELLTDAQSYFHLASALLQPAPSRLIAIGGLSGSGKSTVAELLAPRIGSPPGARILESDRVRKALYQVAPDTKLAPDAYRAEISAKVYEDMNRKARFILGGGGTVIVEAVFANMSDRLSLENMAGDASAHLAAFWLDTDAGVLRGRVQGRESGPSDATLDVLEKQLRQDLGTIDWQRVDAGVAPSAIVTQILRSLTV